jgi:hypothetical protein
LVDLQLDEFGQHFLLWLFLVRSDQYTAPGDQKFLNMGGNLLYGSSNTTTYKKTDIIATTFQIAPWLLHGAARRCRHVFDLEILHNDDIVLARDARRHLSAASFRRRAIFAMRRVQAQNRFQALLRAFSKSTKYPAAFMS